ncbi:MAG: oligosaccharide flippase family protein [Bacteroidota bacterium]
MVSKSFIKSSVTYTVIGALPFASSILLLPFYGNKNLLSTDDFGLLAIFIILSELARILFSFSAESFLGNTYIHYRNDKNNEKKFLGTSFLFLIIYGSLLSVILGIAGNLLFGLFYPAKSIEFMPYGFISVITGFFNGIFKAYTSHLIFREKPKPYFWSNILHFTLVITVSIGGLFLFPLSLAGPIWGRFAGALATFIWASVFFVKHGNLRWNHNVFKHLVKYSAPIYLHNILYWVISNIDRYIILGLLNQSSVAVFDFAIKITLAIEFLQNGLSAAILPKVFEIWKNKKNESSGNIEINKYFHAFTLINLTLIPLYLILIPFLVPLVVNNSDLYQSFPLLPLLFAGMVVRTWYYVIVAPVYYFQKTTILPKVFAATAAFQIAATYFLVNLNGINGAVLANFVTKVLQVWLMFFFVKRFYQFKANKAKLLYYPLSVIVMLIFAMFLVEAFNSTIVYSLIFVFSVAFAYHTYRKEISISWIKEMLSK